VTANFPHWEFWKKALIVLESMEYETKTKKQVPSVVNWIRTIKELQIQILIYKYFVNASSKMVSNL